MQINLDGLSRIIDLVLGNQLIVYIILGLIIYIKVIKPRIG